MIDYQRCPTCGAICTVEGEPEFRDSDVATMHYQSALAKWVKELAEWEELDILAGHYGDMVVELADLAREILEAAK